MKIYKNPGFTVKDKTGLKVEMLEPELFVYVPYVPSDITERVAPASNGGSDVELETEEEGPRLSTPDVRES